jgi:hypothetical protein
MAKHRVREKTGTRKSGDRKGEIVLYKAANGVSALEVRLEQDTVWLNLNQIADLFRRDKSVISRHLHNVYKEKELNQESTVAFFATVQMEGGRQVAREVAPREKDAITRIVTNLISKRK